MNTSITAFAPMWIRCSAWPALQAATPPLLVAFLLGMLFIGPQGIDIQDLGAVFESYSLVAPGALALWSLAMAPAALAGLTAPGLRYLRWLPIPRWFVIAHQLFVILLLQLPLPALLIAAGKPAIALALLGSGLGLSACLLLPSFARLESLLTLGIGSGILLLLGGQHDLLAGALGLLAALGLVPRQYQRAAAPSRRPNRNTMMGGPKLGLLVFQLRRLRRCESTALLRAMFLAAVGIAVVNLVHRANPGQEHEALSLVTLVAATPALALVATILSLALLRGQQELHWLRLSIGISTSRLRRSSLLLLLSACLLLALLLAGTAMHSSGIPMAQGAGLAGLVVVHALFWATTSSYLAYRTMGQGRTQSPAMLALCLALANMLVVGLGGLWVLWVECALALLIGSRILSVRVNQELGHA